MTNVTSLITSKIGESRGVARLWLEGQKLRKRPLSTVLTLRL